MNRGIGSILLNFSVAVYLIATGILGITRNARSEIQIAVTSLFKGDFANVLIYGLAVIAIAAGVFILIKFFGVSIGITETLLLILAVTWVVFVIFVDIIPALNGIKKVDWILLLAIGSHVMVLSGIMLSTERFGS
jgi:hypothetical protein